MYNDESNYCCLKRMIHPVMELYGNRQWFLVIKKVPSAYTIYILKFLLESALMLRTNKFKISGF